MRATAGTLISNWRAAPEKLRSWAAATKYCKARSLSMRLPCYSRYRSEEHTSELQSLMRISYAVFCLKKKNKNRTLLSINNTQTQDITTSIQIRIFYYQTQTYIK